LFEWFFKEEYLELGIKWRDEPIKVKACVFLCEKLSGELKNELLARGINGSSPLAIIPVTSVTSPHQVVQGVVHYVIHGARQHRIRNKGLLLSALILGTAQIDDLVEILEKHFKSSQHYYLVGVDSKPVNLDKCITLKREILLEKPATMSSMVKNVLLVISLT